MKTERLNSPSFCRVRILNQQNISKELKAAIENSKAIKNLGKKYNLDLNVDKFVDTDNSDKIYYGFALDNIKPKNIFVHFYDFVRGRKLPRFLHYISSKTDEVEFINSINTMKKNSITKGLYKKY